MSLVHFAWPFDSHGFEGLISRALTSSKRSNCEFPSLLVRLATFALTETRLLPPISQIGGYDKKSIMKDLSDDVESSKVDLAIFVLLLHFAELEKEFGIGAIDRDRLRAIKSGTTPIEQRFCRVGDFNNGKDDINEVFDGWRPPGTSSIGFVLSETDGCDIDRSSDIDIQRFRDSHIFHGGDVLNIVSG